MATFKTGNFSGWSQDVDGFGAPTLGLNDFTITKPSTGDFAARIEANYWSTSGDTLSTPQDEAFFASTLFQTLDLSGTLGQLIEISFDWVFSGEDTLFDENLLVALGDGTGDYYGADGTLGLLLNPINYGSGTFTTLLDASFLNATGWMPEFQMNAGFDGFGSNALINNVSITAIDNPVPAPASLWLLLSGLLGLALKQGKQKAKG